MKPKEALNSAKDKAIDVLQSPKTKESVKRLADAALEGALGDITGKDGEIKKRKVARRALHPIRSGRRALTNTGRALISEGKTIARETGTDVVKEHISGHKFEIPVRDASRSEQVPVHQTDNEDLPPWGNPVGVPKTVGNAEDTPPWDEPLPGRNPSHLDSDPPPWDDLLPPAI